MPPIERSTPPAISTNVSPIARMRKIELDFSEINEIDLGEELRPRARVQIEQRHGDHDQDDRQERLLE